MSCDVERGPKPESKHLLFLCLVCLSTLSALMFFCSCTNGQSLSSISNARVSRYHLPGMAGRIGWANKPEAPWVVSSWTFRQLLEDVLSQHPDDAELGSELNLAARAKCLFIDELHPELTTRVTEALRETASAICSGRIETRLAFKPYGTAEIIAEYRHALERLVALLGSLPDFAP